ncbi:ComEC family protein [Leclercia adecarboxylata]|uniref:ComEC family protein n=1 Tax=Leclercia adecarboxylata TaxID=83655 RepID=UPI002DB60283|nr:ComEC family protein [Leclercia adecarboxylata]MEB6379085.1 ComEC family protein [Leclercia adecarboxylata]
MRLTTLATSLILAILPLLWLPALPKLSLIQGMMIAGFLLALIRHNTARYCGFWLLFFAWGALAAHGAVWPMQNLTRGPQKAGVEILAVESDTVYRARIIQLNGKAVVPAVGVRLYGNTLPQTGCAGQRWSMTLSLRAVHGQLNDGGFDSQRYALAQHQPLTGRFTHAEVTDARCSLRARYLASLTTSLSAYTWGPVLLGLGMGERLAVTPEIKNLMRETGTGHLMAISGLHIALAASVIWLLVRGIQFFIPAAWVNWRAPLLAGFCFAAFYAWLTGMQPPALRTVVSLGACLALQLSGRLWSPWQVWRVCIAAILLVDPLAVLSHSLLLSAFAVAVLIFWYQWVPAPRCSNFWAVRAAINLLHLQLGMLLLLLPVQVVVFHGFSLSSLVANMVAVPLVTFISVPLILLGMGLHLWTWPFAENMVWHLADGSLSLLFSFLTMLPDGWIPVDKRGLCLTLLPWGAIVAWRMRGARTYPVVCASVLVLTVSPLWRANKTEGWAVHMLDVGQGLAMVIERQGRVILYDTGPAWPGGDSAQQLIIPWLRWHHLHPEGVIVSHEHLDHIGGLVSLRKAWPAMWVRSPLGWAGHDPCVRGERWHWRGLTFSAHWPLANKPLRGNNGSCVVKIEDGNHSVLLTGDIEAQGEKAMLSRHWQYLASTLIQVPHHGSNTSSSLPLVQRVGGHIALVSASRYNAWRLPSVKVARRYRKEGYLWLTTPRSGQLTVSFSQHGWQIHSLRDQILPRWYHQWFGAPGDNG